MSMRYRIWEFYDRKEAFLILDKDVKEVAVTADTMLVEGITVSEIDDLNEKMKVWKEENNDWIRDPDDLREWLRDVAGIQGQAEVEWAGDFEDVKEIVVYCGGSFEDLRYYDRTFIYVWWDGNNYVTETIDSIKEETIVTISNDYVSLDEWDGSNYTTGGHGDHARVYKVFELDGVTVTDMYLIEEWSQWQGSHPTGYVVSKESLPNALKSYGRDPEGYLEEIFKLDKEDRDDVQSD